MSSVAVQLISRVWLFVTPWTVASQSFTIPGLCSNSCPLSQWCHPTISSSVTCFSSCPQFFPAFPMRVFSNELALYIRCPKYWSSRFSISSSNEYWGFPHDPNGKQSAYNAGDLGSISGLGRSPGEGNSYPLQYSGLENSMNCIVHGVTKSQTWLSDFHFHLTCIISWK